ncbi:MAG: PLP-dependent aminotransferase family protein [Ruminococcus sp.]|nr:PLP-dependent aminotransferase family protein [Ruminococcus sp.]
MDYKFSKKVTGLQASAIREILKYCVDPTVISFAAGNPAPEAFPVDKLSEISREIMNDDPILALQYNITEGYTPLRDLLKKELQAKGEFDPERDELIITSGAQQANALTAKVLCDPGDIIITESPSFIGSLNAFKSEDVELRGITLEQDGVNIAELEEVLRTGRVKLIYIIANFQNPTGLTTSFEKRKQIYSLAKQYGAVILEDNPYGDLRIENDDIPSIKSLDDAGIVCYSRTFSKTLAPGIRVGYISAPKEIVNKITVCKQVDDVHTNIWAQVLTYKFMTNVDMKKHIERLREIYRKKCRLMLSEIEKNFSSKITFTRPEGGLFIWCTLPDDCDMMTFCSRAVQEYKVAVVPGSAFMISENDKTTSFRLNFSTPTDEQIVEGCKLLGKLSKEMFGE